MENIRRLFSGIEPEALDKAIETAQKKVKGPKVETFNFTGHGEFNAVGLPVVPHTVTKVGDAGKAKLDWRLVGQQVVAFRNFESPVTVEYITTASDAKWRAAMVQAIRAEVE